ncbi:dihydroxyacetone kinase phosphoryl donor subunit DhaM [Halonatronum saccharophilum]|uniref:dihydroxyacetone kinase phosphoryl donor subunit DhaM n=1 Tax=Halonatronum saccharophilum TaxID=150060 RepID=UPI00048514C1|nr:dihydroxyacetone kinase phosphoryl donor subunit DhaM [Halonatronum saccharophilum]
MVGIVVVSHSYKIAEGVKELTKELVPREVPLISIGGTSDGRIGTELEDIIDAVEKVYTKEGVIIIGDVGSSLMNSKVALEILDLEGYENVAISSAPLVEGAMVAAIESNLGKNLKTIKEKIESKRLIELI